MEQRHKKLLPDGFIGDQVRETTRRRNYTFRTERSYVVWSDVIPFRKTNCAFISPFL